MVRGCMRLMSLASMTPVMFHARRLRGAGGLDGGGQEPGDGRQ